MTFMFSNFKFLYKMIGNSFAVLLIAHLAGCISQEPTRCINKKLKSEILRSEFEYSCPREDDPESFTECCNGGGCCEWSWLSLAQNDEWLLMVTAILVISSCILLTILVVICCFCSKCPLYNTCRANYNTSNVIVYSLGKDDPTPLMPAEASKGSQYHPCAVKITKMQDV